MATQQQLNSQPESASIRPFIFFVCFVLFFFFLPTTSPFSSYIRTCTLNIPPLFSFFSRAPFVRQKIQTRTGPGLTDVLWTWLIPTLVGLVGIKKREAAIQSKHSIRNRKKNNTNNFLFYFWIIGTDGFCPWSWHWMPNEIEVKIITEKLIFFVSSFDDKIKRGIKKTKTNVKFKKKLWSYYHRL